MYRWNLTQTLSNPNDPEWDLLIKLTLGAKAHPERKKGFSLAREALLKCLKEEGLNLSPARIKLKNYSTLDEHPEFTLSLSDSKDCGAAILARRQDFRSIGIDIEHDDRQVKDAVLERIKHPDDLGTLRKIELWCLKEAAFKTLMNSGLFDRPVEFSSIEVGQGYWSHSPSGLRGEWELETRTSVTIARAFLRN